MLQVNVIDYGKILNDNCGYVQKQINSVSIEWWFPQTKEYNINPETKLEYLMRSKRQFSYY